jgi:hypothetical protein
VATRKQPCRLDIDNRVLSDGHRHLLWLLYAAQVQTTT